MSRPVATYLCNKYDKNDKIYPKDSAVRATVDARLYFDMGTFYKAFVEFVVIFALHLNEIKEINAKNEILT